LLLLGYLLFLTLVFILFPTFISHCVAPFFAFIVSPRGITPPRLSITLQSSPCHRPWLKCVKSRPFYYSSTISFSTSSSRGLRRVRWS
jgi:hypothetical protein